MTKKTDDFPSQDTPLFKAIESTVPLKSCNTKDFQIVVDRTFLAGAENSKDDHIIKNREVEGEQLHTQDNVEISKSYRA